jgi:hypothetical protein
MKYLKTIGLAMAAAMALMAMGGVGSASATTLEVGGVTKNASVSLKMSLKSGTSLIMRDTSGFNLRTCTMSELGLSTASPYTGTVVGGRVSQAGFWICDAPLTVAKMGQLTLEHLPGTTNALAYLETQLILDSTAYGTVTCETTPGTPLGTLTGVAAGHATLDVNTVLDCGEEAWTTAKWTATYTVTSPTGLGISA